MLRSLFHIFILSVCLSLVPFFSWYLFSLTTIARYDVIFSICSYIPSAWVASKSMNIYSCHLTRTEKRHMIAMVSILSTAGMFHGTDNYPISGIKCQHSHLFVYLFHLCFMSQATIIFQSFTRVLSPPLSRQSDAILWNCSVFFFHLPYSCYSHVSYQL